MIRYSFALLAFATVFVGCSDSVDPSSNAGIQSAATSIGTPVIGYAPQSRIVPDLRKMTDVEREAYGTEQAQLQVSVGRAINRSNSWSDADIQVRQALAKVKLVPDFMAETLAAHSMLESQLLLSPATRESDEAVSRYLDMLIRHGSPNAELVETALVRVGSVWDAERIRAAKASTVLRADDFVAKRLNCEKCDQDLGRRKGELASTADDQIRRVAAAADRLRTR